VIAKERTLKAREFLFMCEDVGLAALPEGFPLPQRKVMWTVLQFHYGGPAVHFELQPQIARGIVELGLHFEGIAEENEVRAFAVAQRAGEIAGALGPGWEMEEWTASWRRLHRTFPIERLTAEFAREVGAQVAMMLQTLHPVVAELGFWREAAAAAVARRAAPAKGAKESRFRPRHRAGARR
jgi:hypothetical protein